MLICLPLDTRDSLRTAMTIIVDVITKIIIIATIIMGTAIIIILDELVLPVKMHKYNSMYNRVNEMNCTALIISGKQRWWQGEGESAKGPIILL